MSKMTKKSIDDIFGISEASAVPGGMDIRYEATRMDEAREQVLCDAGGRYFLTAESAGDGCEARLGMGTYTFRDTVIMPISRESALAWSHRNLCGNELMAAMEEFGEYASAHRIVWERNEAQEGAREWLMESSSGDFVLYSTDFSYPLCDGSTAFVHAADDGERQFAGYVYVYYIPAETARRWAEAHGMDAGAYAEVFE